MRAGLDVPDVVTELIAVRPGIGRLRRIRTATVTAERPLPYAVDPSPDQDLFGLRMSFYITPSRSTRLVAVYVRVHLDDPRAVAVRMDAEGAQPVSLDGLGEHSFGWFVGDFGLQRDRRVPPTGLGRQRIVLTAAVKEPEGLADVTGTVRVDASTVHGLLRSRLEHATARDLLAIDFALSRKLVQAAGVRLWLAADIERFSRFPAPQASAAQQQFDMVMTQARDRAGIDPASVAMQRSGDGQATVFPPTIDESRVIPLLVAGLTEALQRVNATRPADKIRIRVALDRGHTAWAANGWVGNSIIAVHRLLDSPAARQALADHPDADLVLVVSDVVYRDVIAHGYGGLPARAFHAVWVDIPAKAFKEHAWIYVPG